MGIRPKLGLASPDAAIAQAALSKLHRQAAKRRLFLTIDQIRRQFEGRLGDELGQQFVTNRLPSRKLITTLEHGPESVPEVFEIIKAGLFEEFGIQFGEPEHLQVEDIERDLDRRPSKTGIG